MKGKDECSRLAFLIRHASSPAQSLLPKSIRTVFPASTSAPAAGLWRNARPSPRASSCKPSCSQTRAASRTLRPRKSGINAPRLVAAV